MVDELIVKAWNDFKEAKRTFLNTKFGTDALIFLMIIATSVASKFFSSTHPKSFRNYCSINWKTSPMDSTFKRKLRIVILAVGVMKLNPNKRIWRLLGLHLALYYFSL